VGFECSSEYKSDYFPAQYWSTGLGKGETISFMKRGLEFLNIINFRRQGINNAKTCRIYASLKKSAILSN
jgi:hypothetical protein